MGLLEFFLICIVVGVIIWLIHTYVPLPAPIQTLILVAGVIVLVVILAKALGLFGFDVQIPRIR